MKLQFRILAPIVLVSALTFLHAKEAPPAWNVRSDHDDALYQPGENVTFAVTLNPDSTIAQDGELYWNLSKDGVAPKTNGTLKLEAGKGTITGKLDEPGFLLCKVSAQADGKGPLGIWGVGFSPEKIGRSMPIPQDFDAFWKGKLDQLAAIPINPALTPVPNEKVKDVEAFDTRLDCVGVRVSGYFARPVNAQPKSLPAIITLHGAGVRSSDLNGPINWASQGYLAMDINAHGIDNGKDEAYYKSLLDGDLKNYASRGRESRDSSYFIGMFLRAKRALDFLCSQPEWDGKTLIVSGGSQGGFQAFALAALDERVTIMIAHVPAGCDHSGMLANRVAGWPKLVPIIDGRPDPAVLEASRYIDNVNFAARCKAKTAVVSVGFADTTCPPTSVYAAYNELPLQDKTIINVPGMGHSVDSAVSKQARDIIKQRVGK